MTPPPGTPVRVVMAKWGGRPHWEFEALYLGSDGHGDWCGVPARTTFTRPGATYVAPVPQVMLSPGPAGDVAERSWMAVFHDRGGPVQVYVDMTTPPVWDGDVLRAVDLDLDVVRGPTGRVWVDDEDEFAEHRTAFGYPDDVVADAIASCERVRAAVEARRAPYDGGAHLPWLARLSEVRDLPG